MGGLDERDWQGALHHTTGDSALHIVSCPYPRQDGMDCLSGEHIEAWAGIGGDSHGIGVGESLKEVAAVIALTEDWALCALYDVDMVWRRGRCERIGTGRHVSTGLQPWVMIVNGTGVSHSAADGGNGSNIKTLHTCLIPVGGGREKICRTLPLPGSARDRCGTVGRGLECLHGQLLCYVWHDSLDEPSSQLCALSCL